MSKEQLKNAMIKCSVYSKVVGYCRPLEKFNEGKKQEFKDRSLIDLKNKQ